MSSCDWFIHGMMLFFFRMADVHRGKNYVPTQERGNDKSQFLTGSGFLKFENGLSKIPKTVSGSPTDTAVS